MQSHVEICMSFHHNIQHLHDASWPHQVPLNLKLDQRTNDDWLASRYRLKECFGVAVPAVGVGSWSNDCGTF